MTLELLWDEFWSCKVNITVFTIES